VRIRAVFTSAIHGGELPVSCSCLFSPRGKPRNSLDIRLNGLHSRRGVGRRGDGGFLTVEALQLGLVLAAIPTEPRRLLGKCSYCT
jgi:hypothetical protein